MVILGSIGIVQIYTFELNSQNTMAIIITKEI